MFGRLRRGIRWVASGPIEAFPGAAIASNGRFIGRLWGLVRVGPQADARPHLHEDRSIDLTATAFAHGISIALYNTAMGLIVAIPSMIFYRHYRHQVDSLIVEMESQAVKLVEILHGARQG